MADVNSERLCRGTHLYEYRYLRSCSALIKLIFDNLAPVPFMLNPGRDCLTRHISCTAFCFIGLGSVCGTLCILTAGAPRSHHDDLPSEFLTFVDGVHQTLPRQLDRGLSAAVATTTGGPLSAHTNVLVCTTLHVGFGLDGAAGRNRRGYSRAAAPV